MYVSFKIDCFMIKIVLLGHTCIFKYFHNNKEQKKQYREDKKNKFNQNKLVIE